MFAMKRLEMDRKYALSQQSSDHAHSMAGTIRTRQMTRSHVLQSSPFKNHLEISKVLYSGALKDKMYKSRFVSLRCALFQLLRMRSCQTKVVPFQVHFSGWEGRVGDRAGGREGQG